MLEALYGRHPAYADMRARLEAMMRSAWAERAEDTSAQLVTSQRNW